MMDSVAESESECVKFDAKTINAHVENSGACAKPIRCFVNALGVHRMHSCTDYKRIYG